jgi:hypothetical protein
VFWTSSSACKVALLACLLISHHVMSERCYMVSGDELSG